MKRRKTRGIGIRIKILFPTSIAIVLLCAVMGFNSYQRTKEGLVAMGVEEAQMAASISAKSVDVEQLLELSAGDRNEEQILAMRQAMLKVKQVCGIKYLYTLYTDGERVCYGIDADDTAAMNTERFLRSPIRNCGLFLKEKSMCRTISTPPKTAI
ncbi:MAG: hypothetical protein NC254_14310 [bacterium]|nr:hypothetical protein [bacterium]